MSSVIGNGRYRQSEVCLSLPSIVGARGVEGVLELRLSADEEEALRQSAEVVR